MIILSYWNPIRSIWLKNKMFVYALHLAKPAGEYDSKNLKVPMKYLIFLIFLLYLEHILSDKHRAKFFD